MYLSEREQQYFDHAVADIFGFNALQIGLPCLDLLRANRMPKRWIGGIEENAQIKMDPRHLPFESNSLDLVLLPHVLEFDEQPHQILREVARVIRPEGQVIICGFNPFSLWGAKRTLTRSFAQAPWSGSFISLLRLKDWLTLLEFETAGGKLGCYVPPFTQEKWLQRFGFMEKAGDRWWPIGGGVYFIAAIKRVSGIRVITPAWDEKPLRKKALMPATQKTKDYDC
jgi:SAM-dependent methyltransferase